MNNNIITDWLVMEDFDLFDSEEDKLTFGREALEKMINLNGDGALSAALALGGLYDNIDDEVFVIKSALKNFKFSELSTESGIDGKFISFKLNDIDNLISVTPYIERCLTLMVKHKSHDINLMLKEISKKLNINIKADIEENVVKFLCSNDTVSSIDVMPLITKCLGAWFNVDDIKIINNEKNIKLKI